jgi:hypothetical protein
MNTLLVTMGKTKVKEVKQEMVVAETGRRKCCCTQIYS